MKKPIVLCIIDGYGNAEESKGNAISLAKKPNLDNLFAKYPNIEIQAAGLAVGLPEGQMGNSEVGHLNIGAGRTVYQSLTLINKAIEEKTFFDNEVMNKAIDNVIENKTTLHLMGLLSDGGVHSHINHLFAILKMAKQKGLNDVVVHPFLDGRDVAPDSAVRYVEELQNKINELGVGTIGTISGRYYAMDRDKRWERVQLAYDAMVKGEGEKFTNPVEYVKESYAKEVYDEFVLPGVNQEQQTQIKNGDAIININFRPDRAIQLSTALSNKEFNEFDTTKLTDVKFVSMMEYSPAVIGEVVFKPEELKNILGEVLANNGKTQLRIAETEKYAHVTFFFDGGVDQEFEGSLRVLVNSPDVPTYDLQPEMSANEVTQKVLAELDKDIHDVVILNYANPDMVGHTGVIQAAVQAVETVDNCVGQLYDKVMEKGGTLLITADHGNAEVMLNDKGEVVTAHTTNQVPFLITGDYKLESTGKLGDIAPTMLELLGIEKPNEMDGRTLIKHD